MWIDTSINNVTVLAVDIGTSGCRAVISDQDGSVLANAERTYGVTYNDNGVAEQDPERIFDSFIEVIQQCTSESPVSEVYVAIGSVLHSLLLLDSEGKPLTPLSIWSDTRAVGQCERFRDSFELNKWPERTGCPLSPTYPVYRLLWYKENEPALYNKFRKAVSIKSYIHYRLFGRYVEDHSVASGSGMFNIHARVWDREILHYLGLEEEKLPDSVPVESQLLDINTSLVEGFPSKIKWIIGGADGPLAHLGTAGWNKNVASLTIGTSGAVRIKTDAPRIPSNSSLWCYVLNRDSYITGLATNNGGNVVDWYVNAFYPPGTSWDELEVCLAATVLDPELFFVPFIFNERELGRTNCNSAKFIGLKQGHTRDDMFRAVVEGVVFNVIHLFDCLRYNYPAVEAVAVSGSLTNSTYVRSIITGAIVLPVIKSGAANAAISGLARIILGENQNVCCKVSGDIKKLNTNRNDQSYGVRNDYFTEKYCNWKKQL